MYEIVYTKQAIKTVRRLPRNLARRIREKLSQIAVDPYKQHNNVTKLQNRDGYRLRIGDWCIIYDIEDNQMIIIVLKIASRGKIYQ